MAGEADDGEAGVRLAAQLVPDAVLMDIGMPGVDGPEATRRIAAQPALDRVHAVILTTFDLDEYVFEAIRLGAAGFLVKNSEPEELVRGVRAAAAGDALLSPVSPSGSSPSTRHMPNPRPAGTAGCRPSPNARHRCWL